MLIVLLSILIKLFFCSITFACVAAELINSLPGLPANVSFKQYSGYIVTNFEHGRALFYYFVEADVHNPLYLPLTIWLNGGPGCSSLGFGAFIENGPFHPANNGTPLLMRNNYSWNTVSNMLYVESPIGVGFSYSNTTSDYANWNDTATAKDNMQFIINWFKKFPHYRDSDLFLTGESYAGHYIPQLAELLLEYNKQPNTKPINLKATALENPLLDIEISVDAGEFLWSHGLISDEMLTFKRTACNDSTFFSETMYKNVCNKCKEMFKYMMDEVGVNGIDPGDVLIPACLSQSPTTHLLYTGDLAAIHAKLGSIMSTSGDPCLSDRIQAYLNNPQVQEALHVKSSTAQSTWAFCSGTLEYQMENMVISMIPLLSKLLEQHVPFLLYSGDQDAKIPLTQTRKIANMIAKDLKLKAFGRYSPWYDGKQIGGWTQSFGKASASSEEQGEGGNMTYYMTFATVRGAAHEVPFTSPSQALTLFQAFLKRYTYTASQHKKKNK